jgi:hypothetical protein
MMDEYDDKTIRCPRVGGEVNFKFCRFENNLLPCRFIIGCWQTQIDIEGFVSAHYSNEELSHIFAPPKPKLESLVSMIEKAKKLQTES